MNDWININFIIHFICFMCMIRCYFKSKQYNNKILTFYYKLALLYIFIMMNTLLPK